MLTGFVKGTPALEKDGNFYIPTLLVNIEPIDKNPNIKKLKQIMRWAWRYGNLPIFDEDEIIAKSELRIFPDPDTVFVDDIELSDPHGKLEEIQSYLLEKAKKS